MLSIRRVVTQKSCRRWEHVAVALPFARNYTFKPCVMHIERLIKVTDARGTIRGQAGTALGAARSAQVVCHNVI